MKTPGWGAGAPNEEAAVEAWPNENTAGVEPELEPVIVVAAKFKVGATALMARLVDLGVPNLKGESAVEDSVTPVKAVVCPKLKIGGAAFVGAQEVAKPDETLELLLNPKLKVEATDAVAVVLGLVAPNLNGESVVVVSGAAVEPNVNVGIEEAEVVVVDEGVAERVIPKLKEAVEDSFEDLLASPKDGGLVVEAVDKVFSSFESDWVEVPNV